MTYALENPYFKAISPDAAEEYICDLFEYAAVHGSHGDRSKARETLSAARALNYWFEGLVAVEEIDDVKDKIRVSLERKAE